MRATGGLTVRHGSCWTASVRACHSMPAAMCWGSSAVAENTDHVRATRADATDDDEQQSDRAQCRHHARFLQRLGDQRAERRESRAADRIANLHPGAILAGQEAAAPQEIRFSGSSCPARRASQSHPR